MHHLVLTFFSRKILIHQIRKNFMGMSLFIIWFFPANYSQQPKFVIHVFVASKITEVDILSFKVYTHGSVSVNTVVLMINFCNGFKCLLLFDFIGSFPVLQKVIIGIWINTQALQKPSDTKQ